MQNDTQRNTGIPWLILVLLLALVAYPLSTGPVTWLEARGYLTPAARDALQVFYQPLNWVYHRSETCREVLVWYGGFWMP